MSLFSTFVPASLVFLSILTPNNYVPNEEIIVPSECKEVNTDLPTIDLSTDFRPWNNPKLSEDFIRYEYRHTEEEIEIVAKILYRECRGIKSKTEQACVVWTMCNRVDAGYADTIKAVATAEDQYAWYPDTPVWDELYELAEDVLVRWSKESAGYEDVGRVLPNDYLWFSGDGKHNNFRNQYKGGTRWDYSLETPYES